MKKEIKKNKLPNSVIRTLSRVNYPVGDFLIRIKNAAMAKNKQVLVIKTKLVFNVANALKKDGFLSKVEEINEDGIEKVLVTLSYVSKEPKLTDIKIISKPGLRIYMNIDELSKHKKPSLILLSTPKGVVTSKEAIKENTGGEAIAEIY